MRKSIFTAVLILLSFVALKAQGGVTVNEEPIITKMMANYMGINKATTSTQMIDGFRIQLMATTDRRKVDQVMSAFSARYQDVPITWSQQQPYYRVRIGAFVNRDGAAKYLQNIKKDYPDAYIVTDKVKTTEVMN
ncbi:MAG: SPOR domain-containing protein [Saprospiraceae bacterium]|nr:SPOR domain-containing protein [Saprospiraceae bacterium]